jgi:hypothetical protein
MLFVTTTLNDFCSVFDGILLHYGLHLSAPYCTNRGGICRRKHIGDRENMGLNPHCEYSHEYLPDRVGDIILCPNLVQLIKKIYSENF